MKNVGHVKEYYIITDAKNTTTEETQETMEDKNSQVSYLCAWVKSSEIMTI